MSERTLFSAYSPSQVEILSTALARYCTEHGIADQLERESLAVAFMDIFDRGVTTVDDLLAAMRRIDRPE